MNIPTIECMDDDGDGIPNVNDVCPTTRRTDAISIVMVSGGV